MDFKYTGFISYRRTPWSQKCARFFYKLLHEYEQDYGSSLFFDEAEIKTGNIIADDIFEGIRQSMSLLFFFIPVSIKEDKPWCAFELKHFLDYENLRIDKLLKENPKLERKECLQIIPIIIKGKRDDLPPILQDRLYINFNEKSMLMLRRNDKAVLKTFEAITTRFDSLRDIFQDFKLDSQVLDYPSDYKSCIEKLGIIERSFPTIKINTTNDNE